MGMRIDPDARFRRLKQEAKQDVNAQKQQAEDALRRKFASQGLQASGAAIKAEQQIGKQAQGALGRRLGQIESVQEESALQRQQIQEQRDFARGEREAGQQFASQQNKLQQQFAAKQARLGRDLAQNQFNAQLGLQKAAQNLQKSQFGQQMELAMKQFNLDEEISRFNMGMAAAEAGKQDFFDKAMGGDLSSIWTIPGQSFQWAGDRLGVDTSGVSVQGAKNQLSKAGKRLGL